MAVRATLMFMASLLLLVTVHVDGKRGRERFPFQHECRSKYFKGAPERPFTCDYDNSMCIPFHLKCDSTMDCEDGSDELNCPNEHSFYCENGFKDKWFKGAPMEKFQCEDGMCIEKCRMCDGQNDCVDESDESEEKCSELSLKAELDAIEYQCQRDVEIRRNDL